MEWLRRALGHPSMETPYKMVLGKGIDFLEGEVASLKSKRQQLREYAALMRSLLEASEVERLSIIAEIRVSEEQNNARQQSLWTGQGI
jgi:hypothetical protein